MQFLEGGSSGANGRESRTVRSSDQDPADTEPAAGHGSLMSRYRGAPPPAAPEDEATPPSGTGDKPSDPLPAPGTRPPAGASEDNPWRRSSWTSAPRPPAHSAPTPPATTRPPTAPTPPATTQPATTQPATTQPATTQPATTQPATTQPATSPPPTTQPATTRQPSSQPPASPPPAAPGFSAPTFKTPADVGAGKPVDEPVDKAPTAVERPADKPADIARPAPLATPADTPAPAPTASAKGLLSAAESAEFRRRWRDLQADFVDDPQRAVRGAGDLSREILGALVDTIADAERVDRWKAQDGTSGTEDLRVALRQYRTLVDRLLEL